MALFLQPLSMLYVQRVWWALGYFLVITGISLYEYYLLAVKNVDFLGYFSFTYIVIVICVIHAYSIAKRYTPVSIRPWYSRWYGLILIPLVIYSGILSFRIFFYEPFRLPSGSMLPEYPVGSYIWIEKWGYGNYKLFGIQLARTNLSKEIKRGDVIVFDYPENPEIQFIKRVVALPGDTIHYQDKQLMVNGTRAEYTVIQEVENYRVLRETFPEYEHLIINYNFPVQQDIELVVPEGEYFVLGDNRDNSRDSRYWGYVPAANIVGKVVYKLEKSPE